MVNICKGSEKGRLFFFDLSSFIWFLAYILIPLILVQTRRRKGYEDGGGKDWVRSFILEGGLVILWELRGYGMEEGLFALTYCWGRPFFHACVLCWLQYPQRISPYSLF